MTRVADTEGAELVEDELAELVEEEELLDMELVVDEAEDEAELVEEAELDVADALEEVELATDDVDETMEEDVEGTTKHCSFASAKRSAEVVSALKAGFVSVRSRVDRTVERSDGVNVTALLVTARLQNSWSSVGLLRISLTMS